MSNEIRPTKPLNTTEAYNIWIGLLIEERENIHPNAAACLKSAQRLITLFLLTGDDNIIDKLTVATVSAITYDASLAPILGAYFDFTRAVLRKKGQSFRA